MGEGEDTIVEFCAKLANKQDVKDTAGLAFLREGQFVQTLPRQRIKDVDSIPFPAWDLLPIEVYLNNAVSFGASFGRNMPMLASRGCPYQCTFCSNPQMWTTRYMTRSPDKVLEEIKLYQQRYDITGLQFYDLTAIVRKDWIVEFCNKKLEQNVDLEWSLPSGTRSEALDEEALSLLARTNCKYLVYAPESGSPETLKLIKKKINLDRMKHSVQTAIDCGIVVRANLIMGFPHETRWNMYETLKLQLQFAWMGVDEAPIFPFSPYPGSELFDDLTKKGEIKLNDEYFDTLASLSPGKFALPKFSVSDHVSKLELHVYRVFGFFFFYVLSYLLHPVRFLRSFRNILFSEKSSTVFEQRIKDRLRRIKHAA